MNRQEKQQIQRQSSPPRGTASGGRRQKNSTLLMILRAGMLFLGFSILLVGLLLIILPLFRVRSVEVIGNQRYETEQILEAAGIRAGDEILAVDADAAINNLLTRFDFKKVTVKSSFMKIRITVEEKDKSDLLCTPFNGKYAVFDQSFRVLRLDETDERLPAYLNVDLPLINALTVGGELEFADSERNMDYVNKLIDRLDEAGILPSVTSVDFSDKYRVSFVLQDQCRVHIGKVDDLDTKLYLMAQILSAKGGIDASCAVVDVSNTQKPTYRAVSSVLSVGDQ